ncbi:HD domain-containing protein [Pullulanibacillus sp. KACC 23026]|uniref:HD domain-containing phosphohydrolase n=1 Tax=Pullulanibacillus sp. KACC 23026 TaxID=3028315 RepID=UPI0023AE9599|nr:HD domain-containing phosphohydrolase [Pullulanibacillus sp. KACC 23026]WEG12916.1 HD domain-containing protein [Pullulanibacillus sp. KACC 23026]
MLKGLNIEGKAIETVNMKGIEVSLLASSHDGTEVIRHRLEKGHRWGMTPQEGWQALEFLYITEGKLSLVDSDDRFIFSKGDHLYGNPIEGFAMFIAEEDTEFIYVCSKPVFHHYSKEIKELLRFAIEVEEKDGYTSDHCQRIMELSMEVGKEMELSPYEMYLLNNASFLHDVGKIKVPIEVLNKTTKLEPYEWELIKSHTTFGREILEQTGNPTLAQVGKIIEQHHERYDGKGYPHSLKASEINLLAAIISVVDSYDAMTTDRVYQKARSKEEAIEEIVRCGGERYHPLVVDAFLKIINQ